MVVAFPVAQFVAEKKMTFKHLTAFVALGALSLVVACSGGNGSVIPGPSGVAPDSISTAPSATPESQSDAVPDTNKSPIEVVPRKLKFSKAGQKSAQHFFAIEPHYKGVFRIENACGKHLDVSPKKADGPRLKVDVSALSDIACVVTVIDDKDHRATVEVNVSIGTAPTPTPSTAPSATPSPHPSATPSPHPSATPSSHPTATPSSHPTATPSTHPSATPTPTRTATPSPTSTPTPAGPTPTPVGPTPTPVPPTPTPVPTATPAIHNGNFASGTLTPWTPCSFTHNSFSTPVNASPAPAVTPAQTSPPTAALSAPGTYGNIVVTPPPNLNPNISATAPPLGSYVAETGDQNSESKGSSGICQQITPDATNHFLSFWAYEAGTESSFKGADQEADILDSTGSTVQTTLFSELNCLYDPGVVGASGTFTSSKCEPAQDGGTATSFLYQGGYWVQRGPYDLSAYEGQTVTLFVGVWDYFTDVTPYPDTFGNTMFVGNVQLTSSNAFPSSFPSLKRHKAVQRAAGTSHSHPPAHPQ
jgi:hypothetical protein